MSEISIDANKITTDVVHFEFDGMSDEQLSIIANKRGDRRTGFGSQIPHEIKLNGLNKDITTALGRWAINNE